MKYTEKAVQSQRRLRGCSECHRGQMDFSSMARFKIGKVRRMVVQRAMADGRREAGADNVCLSELQANVMTRNPSCTT